MIKGRRLSVLSLCVVFLLLYVVYEVLLVAFRMVGILFHHALIWFIEVRKLLCGMLSMYAVYRAEGLITCICFLLEICASLHSCN